MSISSVILPPVLRLVPSLAGRVCAGRAASRERCGVAYRAVCG